MNKVSLRNVDIVMRLYKDEQGNRKLKIEAERKPTVVEPKFEIEE
jgi:hypothetical protein